VSTGAAARDHPVPAVMLVGANTEPRHGLVVGAGEAGRHGPRSSARAVWAGKEGFGLSELRVLAC